VYQCQALGQAAPQRACLQDSIAPPLTLAPSASNSQSQSYGRGGGSTSPLAGAQSRGLQLPFTGARRSPNATNMSFHVNPRFDDDSDHFADGPHSPYGPREGPDGECLPHMGSNSRMGGMGGYAGRSGPMMDGGAYARTDANSPGSSAAFDGGGSMARAIRPSGSFRRNPTFGRGDALSSHISSPGGSMVRLAPGAAELALDCVVHRCPRNPPPPQNVHRGRRGGSNLEKGAKGGVDMLVG
jgi:hypothetical protein